ncbi:MAG: hypothetical protein NTX45_22160 [Proteobacteria bacterium]|nr:hypothetical protein [Pseudomonadota bacterium]
MKKSFMLGIGLCVLATIAYAGVRSIEDNGKYDGVPSYLVECTSGAKHVFYKKNGTWYHGLLMSIGTKYDSWSVDQIARDFCDR